MRSSSGWLDVIRSADPLALRVVIMGFAAAVSYGAILAAQGFAHDERTATLEADTAERVVVVTGEAPVDRLVAAALGDATLTLPRDGGLQPLLADVRQLRPDRVFILGGPSTVGADAAAALTARTSAPVTRLAGEDRYATAARAALSTFPAPVHEVLIARSDGATDKALAVGHSRPASPAGRCLPVGSRCATHRSRALEEGIPVLLVTEDSVPVPTSRALQQLRPQRVEVVGEVSDAVLHRVQEHLGGSDIRTGTSGTSVATAAPSS